MKIERAGGLSSELAEWNDRMYRLHPTPYRGLAGVVERSRVRTILDFASVRSSDAVLELGCESGNLLIRVPASRRLVGADISTAALEDCARKFEQSGRAVTLVQLDAQNPLPFARGEFEVIICSEMLEHVPEPRVVLENIRALCDDRTRVVISIPTEAPKIYAKKLLKRLRVFRWLFPGIEEGQSEWHLHAFSRTMLGRLSADLFRVRRARTVWANHHVVLFGALPARSAGRAEGGAGPA
jgi:2-polyprenyl-3-methyl-5-hydroxy-6-metoxy-1,4-benzoquinol methylase